MNSFIPLLAEGNVTRESTLAEPYPGPEVRTQAPWCVPKPRPEVRGCHGSTLTYHRADESLVLRRFPGEAFSDKTDFGNHAFPSLVCKK